MSISTSMFIKDYQKWLVQWQKEGREIWFGTLQFNQIKLNKAGALAVMKTEMERVYNQLLPNISRNPTHKCGDDLPVLIGYPDSPVSKHKPTARLGEIAPNNGMHYHFLLGLPATHRLKIPLDQHVTEKQHVYRGKHANVQTVHVKHINRVGGRLADYLFKHMKRGTYSRDDVLVLPTFSKRSDKNRG